MLELSLTCYSIGHLLLYNLSLSIHPINFRVDVKLIGIPNDVINLGTMCDYVARTSFFSKSRE